MRKPGTKGLAAMDIESKGSRSAEEAMLERAIVLQLLRDDHERMWSREQLIGELESGRPKLGAAADEQTLRRLEQEGVLGLSDAAVWASSAARRLDALGLIGI